MRNILILIFLIQTFLFSQEEETRKKRVFSIPANTIIQTGFNFKISSGTSSHFNSPGPEFFTPATFLSFLFFNSRTNRNVLSEGGLGNLTQTQRITKDRYNYYNNEKDASYLIQPNDIVTPMYRGSFGYTSKSGEWAFEVILRSKNFSADYVMGTNLPLSYNPGKMNHSFKEFQYMLHRNHALNKFFAIQVGLGFREIFEEYNRNSSPLSFPTPVSDIRNLNEKTRVLTMQSSLGFIFKFSNIRLRITPKLFQFINGRLESTRDEYQNFGTPYFRRSRIATNDYEINGAELEGEISYAWNKLNIFLGYTYTQYYERSSFAKKYGQIPIAYSTRNSINDTAVFGVQTALLSDQFLGSADDYYRQNHIKHVYFGAGINF